jgi:hypothetical protein
VVQILNLLALVERFTKAGGNQAQNRLAGVLRAGTELAPRMHAVAGGQA